MNEFRIRATGEVVPELLLRQMHEPTVLPQVIGAETQEEIGVDAILASPKPDLLLYQSIARDGVVQDANGNWVEAWGVRDWSQEEIVAYEAAQVPDEVPMASARIVLLRNGITNAMVRSAIAASGMTELQQGEAIIDWEYRTIVRRTSDLTMALGSILNLTQQQIDGMFVAARDI